jgi:ferrous iron transport protein B
MLLSELKENERGIIVGIKGEGAFKNRISEMGFVKGQEILVIKNAPLKDPIEYQVMGYDVSLRRKEAANIEVVDKSEVETSDSNFTIKHGLPFTNGISEKVIKIVLVGNPNSGKTTFFNYASGANEHVGNYAGVTIGTKTAYFNHNGYRLEMTDLPGTYSLSAYSPEEKFVREQLINEKPDVILNIVDASNLERNLFLTTQIIDLELKTVIGLNMWDEFQRSGSKLNYEELGLMMGIPFVPTVASRGIGLNELLEKIIEVHEGKCKTSRRVHINYNLDLELEIRDLQSVLQDYNCKLENLGSRYVAIKLIENDSEIVSNISSIDNGSTLIAFADEARERIENTITDDIQGLYIDARYGFIDGALKNTLDLKSNKKRKRLEVDDVLTNKIWGYPIFIFIMWLIFQATFVLGQYPMDWIEMGVGQLSNFVDQIMPDGPLKSLLINGIISGVGGVIVFLPNILILFFAISFLEDTGYMARAAFLMDKLMQKMGLQGKSFIPLIMGFGCNVPAIMATRTLENRNHRLLTMLINPFMSCSARLPVYILIIGAIFPENRGSILFAIYSLGILLAIIVSVVLNKFMIKTDNIPFVMELPPYRRPTFKASVMHMWFKAVQYLKKMGGIILLASIIIWALGHYPTQVEYAQDYDKVENVLIVEYESKILAAESENQVSELNKTLKFKTDSVKMKKNGEHQEKSYIGRIGKFVEPIMRPLGFDWKMSVALLTGIAAKEVVISTMGVLYQAGANADESSQTLMKNINSQVYTTGPMIGSKVFTPLAALAFLVFVLIYFPCVAVIAAIKNESGEWKWAIFSIVLTTTMAWLMAFAVYQIGSIFV